MRRILLTRTLNDTAADNSKVAQEIVTAIRRFGRNDWGNVPDEDKEANDEDLKRRDGRLLGKYSTQEGDIYITLDFGESASEGDIETVMFAD